MKIYKHAVVIGGRGAHGIWWVSNLARMVERVSIIDKGDSTDPLLGADLVIIALPVEALSESWHLFELLQQDTFCVFVTGVMGDQFLRLAVDTWGEFIVPVLEERGVEVAFAHCLFGVGVDLKGQNVIVNTDHCEATSALWLCEFLRFISDGALNVQREAREVHDLNMQFTQAAIRQSIISFAYQVVMKGVTIESLIKHSTPPFRLYLVMVIRVLMQPKRLCRQIVCSLGMREFVPARDSAGSETVEESFDRMFDIAVKLLDPRFEHLWKPLATAVAELDRTILAALPRVE